MPQQATHQWISITRAYVSDWQQSTNNFTNNGQHEVPYIYSTLTAQCLPQYIVHDGMRAVLVEIRATKKSYAGDALYAIEMRDE